MAHRHFTDAERSELSILLRKGYSHREIAQALGRSQPSVSREVRRNSVRGVYDPRKAKSKARIRRRYSKYQGMKVRERPRLQAHIIDKLRQGWTPEMIAGRLLVEPSGLPTISAKGIYKWLYSAHGQRYCPLLASRRHTPKKRRGPKAVRHLIPERVGIEERPVEANRREQLGHLEVDTMVSGRRTGSTAALSVLHDRRSRFTRLCKLKNLRPLAHASALVRMAEGLAVRTLTFDNGIENREHRTVASALRVRTYFCRPYHSWEKGSVENTIGRIRRFLPKGTDLAACSRAEIAHVEHWLNHTPRKCLNWRTPYEIMIADLRFTSPRPSDAFEG
jgi:transposase, IS30 family